ncbi:hypothetical protein BDZ45DRAFT_740563 [Acephala macrosclerotiorum]|nr:hypothetical protein BDZ45DRAFT_740563 [Acephala macrosclerotiorum]
MGANEKSHPELIHHPVAANRNIENIGVAATVPDMPRKRKNNEISDAENLDGGESIVEPAASETERTQIHASSSGLASEGSRELPRGASDITSPVLGAEDGGNEKLVSPKGIGLTSAPASEPAKKRAAKSRPNKEFMKNALTKQNTPAVVSHKKNGTKTHRQMQHRELITKLVGILQGAELSLTSDELDESLNIINVIEDKFHGETKENMYARLKGDEENKHPWAPSNATFDRIPPLMMRVWGASSQCRIDGDKVGFTSGGHNAMLDTDEVRRVEISRHVEWDQRKKTSLISMSNDPVRISEHFVPKLLGRRKYHTKLILADGETISSYVKLTLINTHARIAAGKLIMKLKTEAKYNGVSGKFSRELKEYLSPFSIGQDEVIRIFTWAEVADWMKKTKSTFIGWWRHAACIAFQRHEAMRHGSESTWPICHCGCGYDQPMAERTGKETDGEWNEGEGISLSQAVWKTASIWTATQKMKATGMFD